MGFRFWLAGGSVPHTSQPTGTPQRVPPCHESEPGTDPHTWCLATVPPMVFMGPWGRGMLEQLDSRTFTLPPELASPVARGRSSRDTSVGRWKAASPWQNVLSTDTSLGPVGRICTVGNSSKGRGLTESQGCPPNFSVRKYSNS